MLLGLGSDSEIKEAVKRSVNAGIGPKTHLDFENKINKEYFIKEIFQSLDWDDLYEKRDWWDVFGWDRTERMKRVEAIVDEVITEKKIESSNSLPEGVNKVQDLKSLFPFFKKRELPALATSSETLGSADARDWDSTVQRIEREKPTGCTDPKGWAAVMNLSEAGIDHFKTLIRKGVDPKYLAHLSKEDRQTLIHIGNLYRDLGGKREFLPERLQKLFRACDKSHLILFALERKISEHRPFFEKALSVSILKELNGKAEGKMEKLDSFASPRVLKELLDQQPKFFRNRSFKVETRFPSGDNLTVFISNMNALFAAFSRLPVQGNESFNRAVQAALLNEALEMVTGIKPGAVDWQISELTKDPNSGASLSKSPGMENWATEIHDLEDGKVRVDHIAKGKIQDGKKNEVGSCVTRFSYAFAVDVVKSPVVEEGNSIVVERKKYSLSKLEIGKTTFEWNPGTDTPFMPLKGGDLLEVFRRV